MQEELRFSPAAAAHAPTALAVKKPSARVNALATQRDRLLRGIARRQSDIARLTEAAREAATKLALEGPLLAQEIMRLSEGIEQMLEGMANAPGRSKRQRKALRDIYGELVTTGLLQNGSKAGDVLEFLGTVDRQRNRAEFVESSPVAQVSQSGGPARALFRRLAGLLHPDKVQDEREKARRTELMKQATQAYQSGDYGRLIEIERSEGDALEQANTLDSDEQEKELVATIDALRKQSRALDKKLRALRAQGAMEVEHALEEASQLAASLRVVHDFVASFRDGKIDFDRFMAGPPNLDLQPPMADAVSEQEASVAEVLSKVLHDLVEDLAASAPGHRKRGRAQRR